MHDVFQRAMMRRTTRVAGVDIPPFTLARAYCLCAWRNPLMVGGDVGLADFAVALWTCRHECWPWPSFVDAVCKAEPDKWLKRIGKRYDLAKFAEDETALREHILWHCNTPERFIKRDPGNGPSAPWPLLIAVQVRAVLDEKTAWTAPLPYVMAHKIALDNGAGDTSWKSEQEAERGYSNGS